MDVAALRYSPPVRRFVGQHIALDNRDGLIEIGQYPRGYQAAHARSEYHSMLTELRHKSPYPTAPLQRDHPLSASADGRFGSYHTEEVVALRDRVPELGQHGGGAWRVLHHPPVTQTVQHLGASAGALGGPAADLVRADVVILGGENGQSRSRSSIFQMPARFSHGGLRRRTVERQDRPAHVGTMAGGHSGGDRGCQPEPSQLFGPI